MTLSDYPLQDASSIATPALLYFHRQLRQNLESVVAIAGSIGRLRPHVKSHKTSELVKMQLERGIRKFKCATIAEAELLARAGATDILLAYPIVGPNIGRVVRYSCLYPSVRLAVLADDRDCLRLLSAECSAFNRELTVFIDLDPGMGRSGVPIGDPAVQLYRYLAQLPGLVPGGLHCYDGNNHHADFTARLKAARETHAQTLEVKQRIEAFGHAVPVLLMGGTPTFPCYATIEGVELSPGTGLLHDWGYATKFQDLPFKPAALLLTRVISRTGEGSFTLDLGYKGIASDPVGARGIILQLPEAEPLLQNEEHWVFRSSRTPPSVGDTLLVVPTHVCPTSALYQEAIVIGDEGIEVDRWPIAARDRRLVI